MNKTLTINISGIIFHVEEDAFEKLSRYLSTIKSYFAASDGRDEIMADIEARIAELLKEKITAAARQVVLNHDVDQVIAIMGKPEDFATEAATGNYSDYTANPAQEFIPRKKRIFRDPDDKILGGVCSGISAYFNMDPLWLRIIWALSIFVFGFGIILYLLLWVIIPKASTTAEKLEMRGESVNINNIEKTIREELEHLKKKVNDMRGEAGPVRDDARSVLHKFGTLLITIITGVIKLIGKVLFALLVVIAVILLVALLSSIFADTKVLHINNGGETVSYGVQELLRSVMGSNQNITVALIGIALFLGIPLIVFLYNAIARIAKVKTDNKPLMISAAFLWIVGLGLCVFVANKVANEFRVEGVTVEKVVIEQPKGDILYLSVKGDDKFDYKSRPTSKSWTFFSTDDEGDQLGSPSLTIEPSETDSFAVVIRKSSRGETKKNASATAREISYSFSQKDSLLEFNNYFSLQKKDKFRAQEVEITVLVPRNKKVFLNHNMKRIIYDVDNVYNIYDGDMVGRTWIMKTEGLDCIDCTGLEMHMHDHFKHNEEEYDDDEATEGGRRKRKSKIEEPVPPVPPAPGAHPHDSTSPDHGK